MMQQQFMSQDVKKKYLAIVRGWVEDEGTINSPLINDSGKKQEAVTHFQLIQKVELPLANGKFNSSRYSLVKVQPETGRMHQIRKHFAHLRHPIIGDRPHGCNKQNRLFKEHFSMTKLLLHASELTFNHPVTDECIKIYSKYIGEFQRMINDLGFDRSE
jgi:tRNA pseudouridine65 synthase